MKHIDEDDSQKGCKYKILHNLYNVIFIFQLGLLLLPFIQPFAVLIAHPCFSFKYLKESKSIYLYIQTL